VAVAVVVEQAEEQPALTRAVIHQRSR
jgi:hypothetical protein